MVCGLGSVCITPVPVEAWGVAGPVAAFTTPPMQTSGSVAHLLGAVAAVLFLFAVAALAVVVVSSAVTTSASASTALDMFDEPELDPEAARVSTPVSVSAPPPNRMQATVFKPANGARAVPRLLSSR
jgi:hypothetical protein